MDDAAQSDITQLLDEVRQGTPGAADQLASRVYAELHRIAELAMRREDEGHTLQPTELVNDAFQRLTGYRDITWQNRAQFYALAAKTAYHSQHDNATFKVTTTP